MGHLVRQQDRGIGLPAAHALGAAPAGAAGDKRSGGSPEPPLLLLPEGRSNPINAMSASSRLGGFCLVGIADRGKKPSFTVTSWPSCSTHIG